ncbi:NAD(P)H-dependent glycerol-3-phosphate dehydrogenase [Pseudonocardia spinosispora]|uniref:NAD(P)H-dependent glycerol-3-phosphate dehydrogenase n=1 Tax=Pseudonocardia spinosispora TaxID=103441 RepID=UPI000409D8F8|nr:NAD(P)H-dependent glycerol-3-phosphate dehydrogenase [Pseudonocardia spinosispora]
MDRRQPRVAVLGAGSWGTAVASIVAASAPTTIWARSPEVAKDINDNHRNSRYLGDCQLTETLRGTSDTEEVVADADVLIMGVPSHGFREALEHAAPYVRPWIPVVSLVKGLEQGTDYRMTQIVSEVLPGHPAGVLAGPNIASEVTAGYAAAATIAMPDQNSATQLAALFRTERFRIYSTTDVLGVEVAGALKNVFAIAAGMGDGTGAGFNTKAMVITRALREMAKFGEALGGDPATFSGLAGTGDLVVTCTSPASRNRRVGEELGKGKTIAEVLDGMNQVAEGVKAVTVVMEMAERLGIHMPIATEVDGVVNKGGTAEDAYRGLLKATPGHEIHGESW